MAKEYHLKLLRTGIVPGQKITLLNLRVSIMRFEAIKRGLIAIKQDNPDFDFELSLEGKVVYEGRRVVG